MRHRILICLVVLLVLMAGGAYFVLSFTLPVHHDEAIFVVQRGTPMAMIAGQLSRAGVIRNPFLFTIYSRLIDVDRKIKVGEYVFQDGLTPLDVISKLERGDVKLYKLTIVEGWTAQEIAKYLSAQSFAGQFFEDRFLSYVFDPYFAKSLLNFDAPSLEGYLFPDTYLIPRPADPAEVVIQLVNEFQKKFTPELKLKAKEIGMKENEIITLASIVEKETGQSAERATISSVFHNRLKIGMPLQSDPTVIYGLKDFDGNLRRNDLSNTHKYNTYVHKGLPPGPIANPGLESIKAAEWPAETKYLYFVSKNNGTHQFSETLAEHSKAVNLYQK